MAVSYRNKKTNKIIATVISVAVFVLQTLPAYALPTVDNVVSGSAEFTISGNNLEINASDKAIVDYTSFSVGTNEQVLVTLPDSNSEMLNRVVGSQVSEIFGGISCNGRFILVNENGIVFAQDAWLDAKDFILSTRDITNQNFLENNYLFEKTNQAIFDALFVNHGTLTTRDGGFGVVIAGGIDNKGIIAARLGTAALLGGEKVTLDISNDSLISVAIDKAQAQAIAETTNQIVSSGELSADGGLVIINAQSLSDIFEKSINLTGVTRAVEAENKEGVINLYGSEIIENSGTLQTDLLEEQAAGFTIGGVYDVKQAYVENDDNAINLSGGTYSGTTSDAANIIVNQDAEIKLGGDTTFEADDDGQGGGKFQMLNGSTIVGQDNNLTIYSSNNATITEMSGVRLLTLKTNDSSKNPTFNIQLDSNIDSLDIQAGDLNVNSGAELEFAFNHNDNKLHIAQGSSLTGNGTFKVSHFSCSFPGWGGLNIDNASAWDFNNQGTIDISEVKFSLSSYFYGDNALQRMLIPATTYGTDTNRTNVTFNAVSMASVAGIWQFALSGDTIIKGNVTISNINYLENLNDAVMPDSSVNLLASNYALTIEGNMNIGGSWIFPERATETGFNSGTGTVTIGGNIILNESANETTTFTQNGNVTISGNYTQNAGTFTTSDPENNLLTVAGNFELNDGTFDRWNGSGTSADPYIIYDMFGLQAMKLNLSSHFKLNNDISLLSASSWNSNTGFTPIGNENNRFTGSFDGQNNTISNLFINLANTDYVGLFGATQNASIKNLNITSSIVKGNDYVGLVTGGLLNSNIENIDASGIVYGSYSVGGAAGLFCGSLGPVNFTTATDINSSAIVYGSESVGGLVGTTWLANIDNSSSSGLVYGTNIVGGLAGILSWSRVTNSSATAYVYGKTNVGGFIGDNRGNSYANNQWDSSKRIFALGNTRVTPEGINPIENITAETVDQVTEKTNIKTESQEDKTIKEKLQELDEELVKYTLKKTTAPYFSLLDNLNPEEIININD